MKPFREWPLPVHLVVAVIVAALIFWVAYKNTPNLEAMGEEIKQKTEELAKLTDEVQKGEVLERRLPELRKEIAALELQLKELKQIIPPIPDHAQLLQRIRTLADRSRLNITLYSPPQALVDKDFYQAYPINVQLTGTYNDLAVFFDRLRRQSRIFNIENLRIMGVRQGRDTIQANFTATTFIYKEDKPPTATTGTGGTPAGPGT